MSFFFMPTRVYLEEECVAAHAAELASLGRCALLVTGRHSAKACGAYQDVVDALESNGVSVALFDQVEENPSVETILAGREAGLAAGADFCIGIGGGSPMDAAKAIALLMAHPQEDWTFMYDTSRGSEALPVAAVPTTCGTGSEVTGVSVLTRHDLRTKGSIAHRIFPKLALVDGKYLKNAPFSMIANTAMDAFSHMVESEINAKATEFDRMCAQRGLQVFARCKEALFAAANGDTSALTDAVRADLMQASTLAGMAIAISGTAIPHGMSYPLTYELHMPHGMAVAYFIAGYIAEASENDREHVLGWSGFASTEELQQFYQTVCKPPQVSEELLRLSIEKTLKSPAKIAACPYPVDENTLKRIAGIA